jgi:tRNA threonylcarbamoyladenosine biosynthesis protein TsaE
MKETFTVAESDLGELAEGVIKTLVSEDTGKAKVLFLHGDLGAGKTTFTKELAHVLGIKKEDVHSPTFILKKEYKGNHPSFKKLIHVDAYRFSGAEEVEVLKLSEDYEDKETLIVAEWPTQLFGHLKEDMELSFSILDDEMRSITVNYVRP